MKTLVLNQDYRPIRIIDCRRAMYRSTFHVIEYYENAFILDGSGRRHKIPSVVITKKYIKHLDKPAKFSRRNVYIRDNYTCQYTGVKYSKLDLTIDHVIPKSRLKNGMASSFANTVVCHKHINRKKGNKTPEEAGLKLIRQPKNITYQDLLVGKIMNNSNLPTEWKKYINV